MENLNTLESNNLHSIIINEIKWSNPECQNSLDEEITFNFINLGGFLRNECKNYSYYIFFFSRYINQLLLEKDIDCTIDNFSFIIIGENGLCYKSDETDSGFAIRAHKEIKTKATF